MNRSGHIISSTIEAVLPPLLFEASCRVFRSAGDGIARHALRKHDKLHLACGTNQMSGWANADIQGPRGVIKIDLKRRLPAQSDSMSYIYAEHFIEHIEHQHAERLLHECYRVLRPGGVLRISTPDLARLVSEYQAGKIDFWADMQWTPNTPAVMLNEGMRLWGHQFVFDEPELTALLLKAGFKSLFRCDWHESMHEPLRNLECRPFHGELIFDCTK